MPNYVVSIIIEAKDQNTKQIAAEVAEAIRGLGEQGEETGQKLRDAFSGAVLTYAFGRAIPLAREAIETYVQGQSALSGLRSMARATGVDYDTALDQLKAFTSDGLVPMEDATVALRNLLQHGFGLNEAMQILERFKDAAAYGRKEQIELGDAVRIASEAVKVGSQRGLDSISIVGDMSAAHRGLAGELGIEADKLTDAQRLQAEYTSIITQTNTAVGDSAKLHGELAGKIAEAAEKSRQAKEAIGGALAPAYSSLIDSVTPAFEGIARFADECPRATTALIGGAGLVAAVGGVATAFALMGPTGAIVVGVVAGILAIVGAASALYEKLHPSNEALAESATKAGEAAERVRGLSAEYEDLKDKPNKSAEEHERLRDIITELAKKVPEATEGFDAEGRALDLNLKALKEYVGIYEDIRDLRIEQLTLRLAEAKRGLATAEDQFTAAQARSRVAAGQSAADIDKLALATAMAGEASVAFRDEQGQAKEQLDAAAARVESYADEIDGLEQSLAILTDTTKESTDEIKQTTTVVVHAAGAIADLNKALDGFHSRTKSGFDVRDVRNFEDACFDLDIAVNKLWDDFHNAKPPQAIDTWAGSFRGKIGQMAKQWDHWEDAGVDAVEGVSSALGGSLAIYLSGNKDMLEDLQGLWDNFFQWLVQRATEVLVKWLIGKIINSILGVMGMGPIAVGSFAGSAINDKLPRMVTREIGAGLSVSGRGSSDLAVEQIADLTRELRLLVPVLAVESRGGGARIIEEHHHWHVATMDAASLRREIRNGELGREIRLAQRAGRVGR